MHLRHHQQEKTKNQLIVERRDTTEMLMKRRKREMRMQGTKREMVLQRMKRDTNAEAQQSEPPRKPQTRKRTITRWPDDKLTITWLTPTGFPIEKRAQIRMRRLVGLIARQRIFLVLPSFNLLSEQDKITIFDESSFGWSFHKN